MKKFKKFYIEITNVCNLNCDFCPKTGRKPEYMSIDLFCNILDQIEKHTDYIYFHVKGEPLLHPHIDKLLDISYERGFKVNITTNGTLINKVKDKLLMKPGLRQVNFSLHSFDGNEMKVDKEEYINNILAFTKEARSNTDTIISLRLWNLDEEDSLIDPDRKRNNKILELIEKEFNLPYKIQEKVEPGRGIKIGDKLYLNQEYQFQWPDLNVEEDDGLGFCYGLRNQVAILVDGTVVPCCLDGEGVINLGNIKNEHFSDIIEGERAKRIIEGFSKREAVEELCRKCGYRRRFG
ncbi:MAG TPA: radical SAM protein [Clostridiales bacterium]|nr:radical SAM protein [Clostridiales bacterium]